MMLYLYMLISSTDREATNQFVSFEMIESAGSLHGDRTDVADTVVKSSAVQGGNTCHNCRTFITGRFLCVQTG